MLGTKPSELWEFWAIALLLAAAAAYSLYYCFVAWRSNRVIEDTPTSRLRSAAQGYVELAGRGLLLPNAETRAPLSGIPCAWWRCRIEERGNRRSFVWTGLRDEISEALFILDDGTGQCLVDPSGAEVFANTRDVWYGQSAWPEGFLPSGTGLIGRLADSFAGGKYRYTEYRLQSRERIFAVGSLRSIGGVHGEDAECVAAELLREWKKDQRSLLDRFDADHNGKLSGDEWELARDAARRQVDDERRRSPPPPKQNVLSRPTDGRAFLLSASSEESLARRLRFRAAAGVVGFVGSSTVLTWMLHRLW